MYWYNPTTRTSERVQAPSTDEQALQMLAGTPDSADFIAEYRRAAPLGIPDRASHGVGGPRVSLEGAGVSTDTQIAEVASAQQRMPPNFGENPF